MDNGYTCRECGQSLCIVMVFRRHLSYLCDNFRCRLFAYGQVTVERPPEPVAVKVVKRDGNGKRMRGAAYQPYLLQRQINYRLLREAGISSVEAAGMTSNRQTRIALEAIAKKERKHG